MPQHPPIMQNQYYQQVDGIYINKNEIKIISKLNIKNPLRILLLIQHIDGVNQKAADLLCRMTISWILSLRPKTLIQLIISVGIELCLSIDFVIMINQLCRCKV